MNGDNVTNGKSSKQLQTDLLRWQVGVVNSAGKFLTAEPFGFKLNVSATSLKKRQMWVLVPDPQVAEVLYVKSHLNRYLSADKDGKVTCEAETVGPEERFIVEYGTKESGKWSFKSEAHSFYLSGSEDKISCFSKTPVWWSVRLAIHPQVHVRHVVRSRYIRLQEAELRGDQTCPWGYDSLITLEHGGAGGGQVAVRSRDKRYLQPDGQLSDTMTEVTLYNLEIRAGPNPGFVFRDYEGKYLTLIGNTGTMKTKSKTAGRDELFVLEHSYPQVAFKSHNGKFASIKQGVDLYANQTEIGEKETFQLEFQGTNENQLTTWRVRTCDGKCWTISATTSGIKGSGSDQDKNTTFEMEYLEQGNVALKASNNQYVTSRKLGVVSAAGEQVGTEERFQLVLLNRPIMVFRSEFGFVGTRSGRVECNMITYDTFKLESAPNGGYYLRVSAEDYWSVESDSSVQMKSGGEPPTFILQFYNATHLAILAPNGKYLRGEQNGLVRADAAEVNGACLWEY